MQLLTKEEEEVDVMQSWVEAGGFPAQPEEEAKGLLAEASSSPCPPFYLPLSTSQLILNLPLKSLHSILTFSLFFQGLLELLQQASQLWEEVQKLEERAQQLETEGWGKMREVVAGSQAEGLYGLLRGVTSYSHPVPSQSPIKKPHFAPSITISQPPLKSPQDPMSPNLQVRLQDLSIQLPPQLKRRPFWPTCNPSGFKLGTLKGYISARLRAAQRAHQPHGPPCVHTSGESTWE